MENKGTVSQLVQYLLTYRWRIILIFIFSLASCFSALAAPYFLGVAVDFIIGPGSVVFSQVFYYLGLIAAAQLLAFIANGLTAWISTDIATNAVRDMRKDLFKKMNRMPMAYFDRQSAGDILSIFTYDLEIILEGLLMIVNQVFISLTTIIGAAIIMIFINVWIALAVVVVGPITVLIAKFVAKGSSRYFNRLQKEMGAYSGYLDETLSGLKVVQAYNKQEDTAETHHELNYRVKEVGQKANFYSSLVNPSTRFVNYLSYISVGVIGSIAAINGLLSVGTVSSLLNYSNLFTKPLNDLTGITTQLEASLASARRVFNFLSLKEEQPEDNLPDLPKITGNISFKNVAFSYQQNKPLIQDFSIDIKAGQKVAIVGPTGAGKTTMVNLLMRFYEIDQGQILFDGIDYRSVNRNSVRRQFSMVLQETWLYEDTIENNLRYSNPKASLDDIITAAKETKIDGFIQRLEDGYQTIIDSDNSQISNGEKQLLTITRAMLSDAPMLILDEATSNVDPRTERFIQEALDALMKDKTSFVIAHRLSTIQNADIIIVMDNGHIIETGNHDELIQRHGFYYNLYNSQFETTE